MTMASAVIMLLSGDLRALTRSVSAPPWQSPYAYANNNWINQIDILGLAGVKYVLSGLQKRGYIVIDKNGDFIGGVNDSDLSIYLSDDGNWQEENGTEGLERVGLMNKSYADYMAELLQKQW